MTLDGATGDFAKRFAHWLGAGACYPFWKARVALYAILRSIGLRPDDEVLLPGYTCVMNVNPIVYCGARPVFVDIDPDTFNIDVHRLAAGITPRTRAIIAQHTYGIPCDMDDILELGRRHRLTVIEDCCLALGSRYKGALCGTMGDAAYWSFQWSKTLTTGLGGIAAVHSAEMHAKMDGLYADVPPPGLRSQALLALQRAAHRLLVYPATASRITALFRWMSARGLLIGSSGCGEFTPVMDPGFLAAMGASQAAAGTAGLASIEENLRHRRSIARLYEDVLGRPACGSPSLRGNSEPVFVRYPVRVGDKRRVLEAAAANRLEIGSWFESPLHPAETPLAAYGYVTGMCPHAERAAAETVNLPTHGRVSVTQARRSAEFISRFLTAGN
jgi:dTDP-4-amino-4,6-dideoxygalactose transaminase